MSLRPACHGCHSITTASLTCNSHVLDHHVTMLSFCLPGLPLQIYFKSTFLSTGNRNIVSPRVYSLWFTGDQSVLSRLAYISAKWLFSHHATLSSKSPTCHQFSFSCYTIKSSAPIIPFCLILDTALPKLPLHCTSRYRIPYVPRTSPALILS